MAGVCESRTDRAATIAARNPSPAVRTGSSFGSKDASTRDLLRTRASIVVRVLTGLGPSSVGSGGGK